MSNAVATIEHEQAPRLPTLNSGGAVRAIVPQDFESAWRIASAVCKAGMAPRGLDTPEKAMVAILHGLEVGLTPMNALQSIAVINSRATIWGDGALGLVQASGKMSSHKEWYEGTGDTRKAFCVVVRRGDPEPKQGEFSVADAKKAALWGKAGPWQQYSDRMLKMRARAFALRDGFSDVLRGLGIAEEVQDISPKEIERDEPPAPPAVQVTHQQSPATAPEAPKIEAPQPTHDDPEATLKWIKETLEAITSPDDLEPIWNDQIAPRVDGMFPPDQEEALGYFRAAEARLAP